MQASGDTYQALARLVDYPNRSLAADLKSVESALADTASEEAREAWTGFQAFARERTLKELQEDFTRCFDLNPAHTLDLGWHLFGEDYARGSFLVWLRQQLRQHEVAESSELPDHLSHVLRLLPHLSHEAAVPFVGEQVITALDKLLSATEGQAEAPPYPNLLRTIRALLRSDFAASQGEQA